ncbi:MAG: HD domain-containing protein [Planctomycetes bacterium]|nr:HD domain-containing protein [Planctomycetota bacterium]
MPGFVRSRSASLTLRLCAVLAAGALALSMLVTLAGAEGARERQLAELHSRQSSLCAAVAARAAPLLERGDELRMTVLASSAADLAAARVLLLGADGVVRVDTGHAEQGHRLPLETSDGLVSRPLGADRHEVMAPALGSDGFAGEVRVRYTSAGLPPLEFPWSLFGLVFLCSATLVTLAGWMAHSWMLRLRAIAAQARQIARGEMATGASRGQEAGAVAEVRDALFELSRVGAESARVARDGYLRLAREVVHALELRGHVPVGHPERVRRHAQALAEAAGVPAANQETIAEAALVLDLGKAGVRPSAFAGGARIGELELESLREHPARGGSLLGALPELTDVALAVRHHRERWDGSGHPDGLRGERIPIASRVLAIASTYDELLSGDGHRPALSWPDALDALREQSGAIFDPRLVLAFEEAVRADPPRDRVAPVVAIPLAAAAGRGSFAERDAAGLDDEIEVGESPLEVLWDEDDEKGERGEA